MDQNDANMHLAGEKPPVGKWAKVSVQCAVTGWVCILSGMALLVVLILDLALGFVGGVILLLMAACFATGVLLNAVALLTGIVALVRVHILHESSSGTRKAILSIGLGTPVVIATVFLALWAIFTFNRVMCGMNISSLEKALHLYAGDHNGRYPSPQKWCDLLIEEVDCAPRMFVCGGGHKGRSHYAMNPYCEPNCPNDVVLVFETKGGWNQYGGVELLTFDNHGGKGTNVLFNDGHAEFIRPEDVGRLKWRPEDANTIR